MTVTASSIPQIDSNLTKKFRLGLLKTNLFAQIHFTSRIHQIIDSFFSNQFRSSFLLKKMTIPCVTLWNIKW
jgi:hypothetical protein